jgi:hypothetical protein
MGLSIIILSCDDFDQCDEIFQGCYSTFRKFVNALSKHADYNNWIIEGEWDCNKVKDVYEKIKDVEDSEFIDDWGYKYIPLLNGMKKAIENNQSILFC